MLASVIAALGSGLIAAGIAEFLNAKWGGGFREPFYAGIGSGVMLALVGLPFAIKIATFGNSADNSDAFWKWWGVGLLTRLALMAVFALTLAAWFKSTPEPALLSMVGVYLVGMFVEAAFVARLLFGKDTFSKTICL